ncbi:MAG: hypothetical protein AMXMBFR53_27040 [Gemmatimonadota bacterium]
MLLLEDSEPDAELIVGALRRGGLSLEVERVDREDQFRARLALEPDAILADFRLPGFNALQALEILRGEGRDTPFIIVTGSISEEVAVACLKAGAADYVLKDRLARLPQALAAALDARAVRMERERMVAALRSSEARYRQLFMENLTAVFLSTPDGRLVECNPAFARVFGFPSVEAARGVDLASLYPDAAARRALVERIAAGETIYLLEHTLRDVRGDDVHVVESALGIFDAAGDLAQIMGHVVDVSGRKEAERQRDLLATAIEASAETVVITDRDGTIQYVNPAFERTTGFTREEALGRNPRIVKSGTQDDAFYRRMWGALVSGEVWTGRFTNRRKDGTLYQEDASISPVRDPLTGTIENFVGIKRDITRELALEAQLHETQRLEALGRLAGGVAHDFNNLLTVVKTSAELALRTMADDREAATEVREIQSAADRAAALTRQLLAFGRRQTFSIEVLDLGEVVDGTRRMLGRVIGEDVELVLERPEGLWPVLADRGQVEQILVNLAVNARDAMPDGGRLTMTLANVELRDDAPVHGGATPPGPYVVLEVSDTGHGMDDETLARAFEPFFTTKPEGKGTGLGLSTVYGIVRQSGGYVWLYSEPDRGTTARVYLPPAGGVDVARPVEEVPPATRLDGTETILLVEDHPQLRSAAARALARHGYTVLEAGGPEEALQVGEDHPGPVHLIVSDVVLPRMRGSELVPLLLRRRPRARVLFMSGYAHDEFGSALPPGTAFLQKPFELAELVRKVRTTLDAPRE